MGNMLFKNHSKQYMEMPKEKKSKRGRSLTSPNKPEPDIAHGGLKKKQKKPDKGSENENRDQTYKPRIPLEQLCSYGSVINNRYEVRDFLGGGSFGMVLQAYDFINGSTVALKASKDQHGTEELVKEHKMLEHLLAIDADRRRHIIELFDGFAWERRYFIVVELCSISLAEFLNDRPPFSLEIEGTKKIAYQVLEGLEFLSVLGIVHCDLKPSNIMIKRKRTLEIKIIDFGSAEKVTILRKFAYFTTRFYRSPEVMLGLPYSTAIDMWSMGCILWELHTGRPLFKGENELDQMNKIVEVLGLPPLLIMLQSTFSYRYFGRSNKCRRSAYVPITSSGKTYQSPGSIPFERALKIARMKNLEIKAEYVNEQEKLLLDAVRSMLVYDVNKRVSAAQAKTYPFFKPSTMSSSSSGGNAPFSTYRKPRFEYFNQ